MVRYISLKLSFRSIPCTDAGYPALQSSQSDKHSGILKIQFVVIGCTPAGLTSAIALRKVGHEVIVLDTEDEQTLVSLIFSRLRVPAHRRRLQAWRTTGVQMPPSMSKLLYRWGLDVGLKALSVKCRELILTRCTYYSVRTFPVAFP